MRSIILQGFDGLIQPIDLILQPTDLCCDLLEFVRVFESAGTAVGGVQARQVEVSASLAWCLTIAFDLAPFTLVTNPERSAIKAPMGRGIID